MSLSGSAASDVSRDETVNAEGTVDVAAALVGGGLEYLGGGDEYVEIEDQGVELLLNSWKARVFSNLSWEFCLSVRNIE
jgi:hypothetical protein